MFKFKWTVSDTDLALITAIAERGHRLAIAHGAMIDKMDIMMNLIACHNHPQPLRLADMAEADDFNLMHDVYGLHRHLDRNTGELTECFSPRFSV